MRITKYIHSCLSVEKDEDKLLFDPGKFSFAEGLVKPEQFRGLSAIILTHSHPDHVDYPSLEKIIRNNPSALVLTNRESQAQLARKGIRAEIFETGARVVGSFALAALDAPHAPILDSASPQNTAYLIDDLFLNPGDSFAKDLFTKKRTPVLALPIMAPWTTELEVAEFTRNMSPQRVIPVHDGYAKEFFLEQRYRNFKEYFSKHNVLFEWAAKSGDSIDI